MKKTLPLNHGLNIVYTTISSWIQSEITNGILCDVNTFYDTEFEDGLLETPLIWVEKERIYEYEERSQDFGRQIFLNIGISITCGVDNENQKEGEQEANNLLGRILATINLHKQRKTPLVMFHNIKFKSIDPAGTVEIVNKQETYIAARVRLQFIVSINWMKCCHKSDTYQLDNITLEQLMNLMEENNDS